jgi:diguanylate cyclase (GGDEF)-like protein
MAMMAVDVYYGGIAIVSAILVSCMTLYLFLRGQDTDHDPLTRLWNRLVFYEDCRRQKHTVTAIASIDMNGLKRTNDELGHEAGDRALKMIGRALRSIMSRKILAYRIGGDEFTILFLHCNEEEVQQALTMFQNEIWRVGLSVAIGYILRTEANEPVEELFRLSDKRMYEDKRMYYQLHDRRRSR